jgi:hypothetical protein
MVMPVDQTLPVLCDRQWLWLGLGNGLQKGLTGQLCYFQAEGERAGG